MSKKDNAPPMNKNDLQRTLRDQLNLLFPNLNFEQENGRFLKEVIEEWSDDGQEIFRQWLAKESINQSNSAQKQCTGSSLIEVFVNVILKVRSLGKFPFYNARLMALFFKQEKSLDQNLAKFAEYTLQVGIKHALRRFTILDRQYDIYQIIYEQYVELKNQKHLLPNFKLVALLKKTYEHGYQAEVKYHGCSQCVMLGLGEVFSPISPDVFKSATALSGGMAQCGDGACGGYTGGILYMGTYIGRSLDLISGDKENQYRSFAMAQKLHDKYIETYGSILGKDIHEAMFGEFYLLRDPVAKTAFSNAGAHEYICPCVVGNAARWVAEILYDEQLV